MLQTWLYFDIFNHIFISLVLMLITNFVFYNDSFQIKLQFNLMKFIFFIVLYLHWFLQSEFTIMIMLKQLLILISLIILMFWEINWYNASYNFKIETLILFLLSTGSMILLVSSLDLILIYILLETQGLMVYTLLTISSVSDMNFSIEASLKYFILGGIASSFLLVGTSMLYNNLGSTNLMMLAKVYSFNINEANILNLSCLLMFLTLMFKLGLAPFHAWSIDVSKASPNFMLVYILTAPKIRLIAIMFNINKFLSHTNMDLNFLLKFQIIASILVGSYGGIYQLSLRKIVTFSSISTIGLVMIGLIYSGIPMLNAYALIYFIFYMVLVVSILGLVSLFFKSSQKLLFSQYVNGNFNLKDLQGMDLNNSYGYLGFGFLIFNLMGVRPLMGFYLKFYLLTNMFNTNLMVLGMFILMVGIMSMIMYLSLIKQLYLSL